MLVFATSIFAELKFILLMQCAHQMEAENIRNSNDENKIFENRANWSEDVAILINSQGFKTGYQFTWKL